MSRTDSHVPAAVVFDGYESAGRRQKKNEGFQMKKFIEKPIRNGYTYNGFTVIGVMNVKCTHTREMLLATDTPGENEWGDRVLFAKNSLLAPNDAQPFFTGKRLSEAKFVLDEAIQIEHRLIVEEQLRAAVNEVQVHKDLSRYTYFRKGDLKEQIRIHKFVNQRILNSSLRIEIDLNGTTHEAHLVPVNISINKKETVYTRNEEVTYGMITYMIILGEKYEYTRPHWTEYSLHDINQGQDEIRKAHKHFSRQGSEHWYAQKDHTPRSTRKMQLNNNVGNISGLTEDELYDIFDTGD